MGERRCPEKMNRDQGRDFKSRPVKKTKSKVA